MCIDIVCIFCTKSNGIKKNKCQKEERIVKKLVIEVLYFRIKIGLCENKLAIIKDVFRERNQHWKYVL